MKKAFKGSALLTVLLLMACLLVLCVAFGVAFSTTLNLSNLYVSQTRSYLLAQSAAQQLALQLKQNLKPALIGSPPQSALSVLGSGPLLASGGAVGGQATLVPGASRDNLASSLPAQSSADQGSAQQSLAPNSVGLVINVTSGGQTTTYDATVQQRWPYAVAASGPIVVGGNFTDDGRDEPVSYGATTITGDILALSGNGFPRPSNNAFFIPDLGTFEDLSNFGFSSTSSLSGLPTLQVGGSFPITFISNEDGSQTLTPVTDWVTSNSAVVQGDVALVSNAGTANSSVDSASTLTGSVNTVSNSSFASMNYSSIFQFPPITSWATVAAPGKGSNVYVSNGGTAPSGFTSIQAPNGGAVIQGNLTANQLTLENCTLGVNGDLIISRNSNNVGLLGTGATLVVNGTLFVVGADLSTSGSSGMVIYCRQAFLGATGQFSGLIVAENGINIFGPPRGTSGQLNIDGGILVGSNNAQMNYSTKPSPLKDGTPSTPVQSFEMTLPGVTLAGCNITYNPQFMSYANQFGNMQVVSVTPRT